MIKALCFVILTLIIVVSLLLFYVWERATSMQLTIVLDNKKEKLEKMRAELDSLHLEYLDLTSIIRIERIAKEKLNMRYPKNKEVRFINRQR
jgi:cell division protein FtsL